MTRTWLIVGCGYTGTQLARTLAAQARGRGRSTITRRDGEVARALGAALGVRGERLDLADGRGRGRARGAPGGDRGVPRRRRAAIPRARSARCSRWRGTRRAWCTCRRPGSTARAAAPGSTRPGRSRRSPSRGARGPPPRPRWPARRCRGSRCAPRGSTAPAAAWSTGSAPATYRVIGDGTSHVSRIHVVDLVAAIIAAGRLAGHRRDQRRRRRSGADRRGRRRGRGAARAAAAAAGPGRRGVRRGRRHADRRPPDRQPPAARRARRGAALPELARRPRGGISAGDVAPRPSTARPARAHRARRTAPPASQQPPRPPAAVVVAVGRVVAGSAPHVGPVAPNCCWTAGHSPLHSVVLGGAGRAIERPGELDEPEHLAPGRRRRAVRATAL